MENSQDCNTEMEVRAKSASARTVRFGSQSRPVAPRPPDLVSNHHHSFTCIIARSACIAHMVIPCAMCCTLRYAERPDIRVIRKANPTDLDTRAPAKGSGCTTPLSLSQRRYSTASG